eukprot:s206_g44.t1
MEAVNLDGVIKQVCRTLKQWSIEGPPRNPRKAAGDLATLLEDAGSTSEEHSANSDESNPKADEVQKELERKLQQEEKEKKQLEAKLKELQQAMTEQVEMLQADLESQKAANQQTCKAQEEPEVALLRRRFEALSSHLSSVLTPVSAACRTRPLSSFKDSKEAGSARALTVDGQEITVEDASGRSRKFKIDRVLDGASQEDLFLTAAPWVEHAALGGSSCVFAYGATGSGKTHSILGAPSCCPGLAHHAIRRLIEGQGEVKVSMLEVYCEQIRDLLAVSEGGQPTLQCSRRDGQGRMLLDCVEVFAAEASEADALLQRGFKNRATEGTLCNDSSSRSHVVLTVQASGAKNGRNGRLVLVDLAGSENVQRSGADEDAKLLAEAKAINRSLSALADVVEATAKQQSFVPYRNSRLTMLLEEVLSVSRVLLLVHVSPFQRNSTDTAHSLAFASRVRAVDFGAERLRQEQEDRARAAQQRIQQEARQLQQQLDQAKRELAESQKVQSEQKQQASQLNEQLRERQRELIKEQELRSKAEEKVREYRLADRRATAATETGRTISPRVWTKPTRVAVAAAGNAATGNTPTAAPNKVVDARQTTPAKQRPVSRMVENEETSLQISPGKTLQKDKNLSEILPRAPFLDRTNNENNMNNELIEKDSKDSQQLHATVLADVSHMSPTKIITPRDGLLTPDRWAINRSPLADRMEVRLGNADIKMRSPSRSFLYNGTQVRTVLKRVPTDFKGRLQRKQEFGSTFPTGGKHVTFAEEEKTACSPPRWYLDMLEYEQACKLAEAS